MDANSQVMMLEEKLNQFQERQAQQKDKIKGLNLQVDERDQVILDMKKRLECEQTD